MSNVRKIEDGIYQLRLPLPFALNHVQCYLLRGDDGWTVLDTGLNTTAGRTGWQEAFAALQIAPGDVKQIIITHCHPDHYGLAGWLQEQCRAAEGVPPVFMSQQGITFANQVWKQHENQIEQMKTSFHQCGIPPKQAAIVANEVSVVALRTRPHPEFVHLLQPDSSIQMGNRTFKMIHAPGHADGQIIFYDVADRLLLCGDHVLNDITPHIGRWPNGNPNPLALYLNSLQNLLDLDVRLALPGHKTLITNWQERLNELLLHHDLRLQHTLDAIGNGATAFEVGQKVFGLGNLNVHNLRFAIVETLAHLDFLITQNRIGCRKNGVWQYYLMLP
ncbi:MAG: MBL fold metallo-hydrolase [Chloroflexi bacterium]|nr:MBL fold metallo-hydrolase [Chloroflexota bacterium]